MHAALWLLRMLDKNPFSCAALPDGFLCFFLSFYICFMDCPASGQFFSEIYTNLEQ